MQIMTINYVVHASGNMAAEFCMHGVVMLQALVSVV